MGSQEQRQPNVRKQKVDFTDFFENAPVGLHCVKPNGLISWVNQAELDMLGYTRKEYIGRHISEFHVDQPVVRNILKRLAKGETLDNYEARLLCKNGRIKHVLISSNGLWKDGEFLHSRCFIRDITDRKKTETQLRQMEAKHRALLESTGEGIYGLDLHGRCTFANQAAARMLGYRSDNLLGKPMHELIHHSTADGTTYSDEACPIYRTFRTGLECRIEGEVLWRRDGTSFPAEYSAYPVFEKGVISGAVVTFTDITERQQIVQALRESEERFRQLTEHIHEVFWMTDPKKDRMLYISPGYEAIWGRSREALYADPHSWLDAIHPDDQESIRTDALRRQISGDYDVEYRIVRPDGSVRWIHDRAFPIRDQSGAVHRLAGIAEDVTEYKHANEELQKSLAQSHALSSYMETAREEERSRIGQELHDSLGGVLTYLKLDLIRLNQNLADVTTGDASHQLQRRIREMTDAMDAAIKTVQRISVDIRPVLLNHCGLGAAIIWQAREFEDRTGIRCVFTDSPNVCEMNHDQSILVFRIFQEALTNVARHAHAKTVRISLHEQDGQLTLIVEDDGDGISKEKVSDPTSFGLLGMQERARLAGGELSIRGGEGNGTQVAVRIPVRDCLATN